MDHATQLLAEVQVLGTLCSLAVTSEQRDELAQALNRYSFLEPEHEIIFESIRALLLHHWFSYKSLAVNLNNRGFPDVDLDAYCAAALPRFDDALALASQLVSIA